MPRAVPMNPARAKLNAVLVRVRILVVISARKLAANSRRFVKVIIFDGYPYLSDYYMRCCGISGASGEQSVLGMG